MRMKIIGELLKTVGKNEKVKKGAIISAVGTVVGTLVGTKVLRDQKRKYEKDGYNGYGYDKDGYNREGYNRNGLDREGYGRDGYNWSGYNREGYKRDGYNAEGRDREGYDLEGYSEEGYDCEGYNKDGFDREGYDRDGYNWSGCDREGYGRNGYNLKGYDREGYDSEGYDSEGYNRKGYNSEGYDREGYNVQGYNSIGFNRQGYDRTHNTKQDIIRCLQDKLKVLEKAKVSLKAGEYEGAASKVRNVVGDICDILLEHYQGFSIQGNLQSKIQQCINCGCIEYEKGQGLHKVRARCNDVVHETRDDAQEGVWRVKSSIEIVKKVIQYLCDDFQKNG